jgi:pilus assembly protein FimV
MTPRLLRLTALSAALFSSYAGAVGFGEIILHSRIGEPLRADIPLHLSKGETIDGTCFTLDPIGNSELPVITKGSIKLIQDGGRSRLSISGGPVLEPIFVIGLRAGCGADLRREFVLMPDEPIELAMAATPAPVTAAPETRAKASNIAERDASGVYSNVEPAPSAPPAPKAKPKPKPASDDIPPPPRPKPRPAPKPPAEKKAAAPEAKTDRIVLGAPPTELRPGEKATAAKGMAPEAEQRIVQLESTLSLLNEEVDRLNKALALTAETLAAQQKLQAAQAALQQQNTAAPAPVASVPGPVPAAAPADSPAGGNWLELLLSALAGGAIAAGLARIFAGQRQRNPEAELPLAVSTYRPPAPANPPTPPAIETPVDINLDATDSGKSPQMAAGLDLDTAEKLPAAGEASTPADVATPAKSKEISLSEGDSLIELAEIMLSFGRVRGAADTLAQYIEENSPANIQPWLMLLDLYRRSSMPAEFENLAQRISQRFNVQAPVWGDSEGPQPGLKSLEDYAHVTGRVTTLWPTQEAMNLLNELVHENRGGARAGFPLEVIEEIVLLMHLLEDGYGLKRPA